MSAHLAKKLQARHNPVIEVNEFRFGSLSMSIGIALNSTLTFVVNSVS
jgi:hypothetical protein